MKIKNKVVVFIGVFCSLTIKSAYSVQSDNGVLSSNLQVLKNIEKSIESNHVEIMKTRNYEIATLISDMKQINSHLADIEIILKQIIHFQKIGLKEKNNSVSILINKENSRDNKSKDNGENEENISK